MIKLNNKNITYVALADSNNSLKAPKEIWYADSSNSVKLVYQRKDALTEGEDYEKYHWLKGKNGAYINTGYYPHTYDDAFYCHYKWDGSLQNPENRLLGVFGSYGYGDGHVIRVGINNAHYINYFKFQGTWNTLNVVPPYDITLYLSCYGTKYKAIVNGVVNERDNNNMAYQVQNRELVLFENIPNNNTYFNGDIASFRVSDPTFTTDKLHFIPCKLLQPVPKWLDANGIRRQVGECGMIDLVSGKFYGNVNSVGTFTVENYYERKEWLIGDGSAYIDTNIIVDVPSLYISTSFTKKIGGNTPLFGSRDFFSGHGSQIWYLNSGNLRLDIITNGINWIGVNSSNLQNINQLIVDCPNKVININGIAYSSGVDDLSIKNSSNTFKIYSLELLNSSDSNNVPYHGAFGNFTLNDSTHSLNLIPCTLTMDLPASMDANNIARTKGTSGMWDLVSDRFYGNVANNGTFKAVNLAEGVDYEVHQWLKAVCPVNKTMMMFPIGSQNFNWKVKIEQLGNISYFRSDNYSYYTTNKGNLVHIWDAPNKVTIFSAQTAITDEMIVNISSTSESLTFNGETIPKYEFPNILFKISNASNGVRDAITYISSITVDGVNRYIPVKLLKSIPSKYDANGIARHVGECGMYDTVNDVFYGNVASSGTFSVSDDS